MKKTFLLFSFAAIMLAGCTKNNTTNNITTPLPAFVVDGIHDIALTNDATTSANLEISVQYSDSSQEVVSLSLSSLPAGITMDTVWVTSGIPSFSTNLIIYDTTANGATVGTYPMTLTATGATTGKKTYNFNIKVGQESSCTGGLVGAYTDCEGCAGGIYRDSVYADPTVANKIWFTNFNNSGSKVYALYNCSSEEMTIPSQIVAGVTYSGSSFANPTGHSFLINVNIGSSSCEIDMD